MPRQILFGALIACASFTPILLQAQTPLHATVRGAETVEGTLPANQAAQIILRHRGDLGLTDTQVTSIEGIAEALRVRNDVHISEIDRLVKDYQSGVRADQGIMGDQERARRVEEGRLALTPMVVAVARANMEARDAIRGLLSEDQKVQADVYTKDSQKQMAEALFH